MKFFAEIELTFMNSKHLSLLWETTEHVTTS